MNQYHQMCWLNIVVRARHWPPRARRELATFITTRGTAEHDHYVAEAGRVLHDYSYSGPRSLPERPEHRA